MIKQNIVEWIKQYKIVAIIKGVGSLYIEDTIKALYEGGIRIVEITLKSDDSLKSITMIRNKMGGKIVCGAGTVMNTQAVDTAVSAGAQFISCIHSDESLIKKVVDLDRVCIAGALTPTNIISAKESGSNFINVFPAISVGADYFKQIKSPFSDQFLFAVGGIDLNNAREFLKAGAHGIGVGNSLVNPRFIKDGNYLAIADEAKKYVELINGIV
ncbi:UNVERIFIED_CONTAM: 2-dehydro-3-deoxyphosphogluconate aldolase/(4S)-4-hydroxy-2-oxoglutarate aldolase [Acetivibrio alkalicellulosi]